VRDGTERTVRRGAQLDTADRQATGKRIEGEFTALAGGFSGPGSGTDELLGLITYDVAKHQRRIKREFSWPRSRALWCDVSGRQVIIGLPDITDLIRGLESSSTFGFGASTQDALPTSERRSRRGRRRKNSSLCATSRPIPTPFTAIDWTASLRFFKHRAATLSPMLRCRLVFSFGGCWDH
jgi:hypothetical protein